MTGPAAADAACPGPGAAAGGAAPVGLIAGSGSLPVEIAGGARRCGRRVVCVGVQEPDPRLPEVAEAYYALSVGELDGMITAFQRHGVREVLLAGKVDKLQALRTLRLDVRGLEVVRRAADLRDASILAVLTGALQEAGFDVGRQTQYIGHLVPPRGVLGRRGPSAEEDQDIRLGLHLARGVAALDIGQAVAIRRGVVVAVEAAEGTDEMIRRAGALAVGVVVVKVSRPRQDPRFDLPVVGLRTVEALAESRGTALAIEAGKTILLGRDDVIARADAAGIAVVAVEAPEGAP